MMLFKTTFNMKQFNLGEWNSNQLLNKDNGLGWDTNVGVRTHIQEQLA